MVCAAVTLIVITLLLVVNLTILVGKMYDKFRTLVNVLTADPEGVKYEKIMTYDDIIRKIGKTR